MYLVCPMALFSLPGRELVGVEGVAHVPGGPHDIAQSARQWTGRGRSGCPCTAPGTPLAPCTCLLYMKHHGAGIAPFSQAVCMTLRSQNVGLSKSKKNSFNLFFHDIVDVITPKRISPDCPFKIIQRLSKMLILTPRCAVWLHKQFVTYYIIFIVIA